MADQKISAFPAATSVVAGDVLPIIQTSTNKKVDVSLLKSYVNSKTSVLSINTGTIDLGVDITLLNVGASPINLVLTDGQQLQQIDIISVSTTSTATVVPTNFIGHTNLVFTLPGQCATLIFLNGAWYLKSSSGVTVN